MKKIEFGYSNDLNPTGSHEGMGISPGVLLAEATYYGVIIYEGKNYMVAKVDEDEFGNYPGLLDNFVVREALYDLYPDGSGLFFITQDEDDLAHRLAEYLNNPAIKSKISNIDDILYYVSGAYPSQRIFKLAELDDLIVSTSITQQAFDEKKAAINNCRASFSQLGMEKQEYYGR